MGRIDFTNSQQFASDLQTYGDTLIWKELHWFQRTVRWICSTQEARLLEIMKQFQNAINRQELEKVGNPHELVQIYHQINDSLIQPYFCATPPLYKRVIWMLQNYGLQKITLIPTPATLREAADDIALRIISLGYRNNLISKVKTAPTHPELAPAALKWKQRWENYTPQQQEQLTPLDLRILQKVSRYGEFSEKALKTKGKTQQAFKFLIRDAFPMSIFVRFPAAVQWLYKANLTTRVAGLHTDAGEGNPKMERIAVLENGGLGIRFAYLNRLVDILSEKTVKVADDLEVPLQEVMDDLEGKRVRQGKYEMFWNGIHRWDPHHYSVPMDKLDWYWQLPILDKVKFTELKQMFASFNLQEGDRVWCLGTTRQTKGMHAEGSHGYIVFYEPDPSDGLYRVWSFGTFAEVWPETGWATAKFIGNTVQAVWAYPEPNYAFYPHRQQALKPIVFRANETEKYETQQRRFREAVQNKHHAFMWGDDNCVSPAETLITGKKAELTRTFLDELEFPLFMRVVVGPHQITPGPLKDWMRAFIIFCIGGVRQFHGKSLWNTEFRRTGYLNYPGMLNKRILLGEVEGVVHGGHNREFERLDAYSNRVGFVVSRS